MLSVTSIQSNQTFSQSKSSTIKQKPDLKMHSPQLSNNITFKGKKINELEHFLKTNKDIFKGLNFFDAGNSQYHSDLNLHVPAKIKQIISKYKIEMDESLINIIKKAKPDAKGVKNFVKDLFSHRDKYHFSLTPDSSGSYITLEKLPNVLADKLNIYTPNTYIISDNNPQLANFIVKNGLGINQIEHNGNSYRVKRVLDENKNLVGIEFNKIVSDPLFSDFLKKNKKIFGDIAFHKGDAGDYTSVPIQNTLVNSVIREYTNAKNKALIDIIKQVELTKGGMKEFLENLLCHRKNYLFNAEHTFEGQKIHLTKSSNILAHTDTNESIINDVNPGLAEHIIDNGLGGDCFISKKGIICQVTPMLENKTGITNAKPSLTGIKFEKLNPIE